MFKFWKTIRGYKRHAGAIVAIVPIILQMFGVEIPEETMKSIVMVGSLVWGIGWVDKGAAEVTTRLGNRKK